ncbi:hypothetical protein [Streptomyces sp. NPDC006463]|uniref:hypothetical protein n=1 Tax=Streptomyces sp. NPDC006463 TaxID=3364746 RepID=UPI0036C5C099
MTSPGGFAPLAGGQIVADGGRLREAHAVRADELDLDEVTVSPAAGSRGRLRTR